MQYFIDYFLFIFNKIVEILDSIRLPGSSSLLMYMLGAIIIGLIFRLLKGGSNEFEQNTNFLNGRLTDRVMTKYINNHRERKKELVDRKLYENNVVYEYMEDNF